MSKKVQTLLKELEEIERKLKKQGWWHLGFYRLYRFLDMQLMQLLEASILLNFQGTYIPDFTAYEGTTLQRDKSTGNTKCQKKKLKNNQEKFLVQRIAQVS